jgi:RNA polymerase sigma-70 factor (ECF subfamily)
MLVKSGVNDPHAEREGTNATVHRLDDRRESAPLHTAEVDVEVAVEHTDSQVEGDSRELLSRARRHDPSALRQLFELHKDRVAAQIQRMTGDPGAVDDLVQEVFIAAFANLASFRGDSQFRTWLYRIATNKVRNWWDSDQRRRRREHRSAEGGEPGSQTPDEDLETREHRERLYGALAKLSSKLREAFVARVIEGMSLQEASEVLGVPISTVSYRTRRAEDLLCAALGIPGHVS